MNSILDVAKLPSCEIYKKIKPCRRTTGGASALSMRFNINHDAARQVMSSPSEETKLHGNQTALAINSDCLDRGLTWPAIFLMSLGSSHAVASASWLRAFFHQAF